MSGTPSAAQAEAFFAEVIRDGVVWTLRDAGGVPAPTSSNGTRAMPFWSLESRARRVLATVAAYEGFEPESIPLATWHTRWLACLERDGLRVGINWSGPRATGFDLTPDEVVRRLTYLTEERAER